MEYSIKNKKISAENVAGRLKEFFKEQNFETKTDNSNGNIYIVAHQNSANRRSRKVKVIISKNPNGLTVKFEAATISPFKLPMYVSLIPLFGGGMLLKKELESNEFYQKLEEQFCRKLDEIVSESSLE